MPEDVDWSFVLHVDPVDGSIHKVDDKRKPRFQYNAERTDAKLKSRKRRPEQIRRERAAQGPKELLPHEKNLKVKRYNKDT